MTETLTTLQLVWFVCAIIFGLVGTILGIVNVILTPEPSPQRRGDRASNRQYYHP